MRSPSYRITPAGLRKALALEKRLKPSLEAAEFDIAMLTLTKLACDLCKNEIGYGIHRLEVRPDGSVEYHVDCEH